MTNYLTLMVGALFALSNMDPNGPRSSDSEWNSYKAQYNKTYSDQEDLGRRLLFDYSKQRVESFNAQGHEYQLGLNKFSDRTPEEMTRLNGYRMLRNNLTGEHEVQVNSPEAQAFLDQILGNVTDVPDQFDWRKIHGRVSEVKDQKECGSCWAFSAIGALEGQIGVRGNGSFTQLSEQNLVDCDKASFGCDGGSMDTAFKQVKREGGIESEKSYPYLGVEEECRFKKNLSVFSDAGSIFLPRGDEEVLKKTVAQFGPVSVGISAQQKFFSYHKGVFVDENCPISGLNHAVLVVGYGTDKQSGDYWIVKNSWGKNWGEGGYIRMARNRNNMCGIASEAIVPLF